MSKRALAAVAGIAAVAALVFVIAGRESGSNSGTKVAKTTERSNANGPKQTAPPVAPVAPAPVTVSGTVTAGQSGTPVEGALVQLEARATDSDVDLLPDALTARSAADGSWSIADVAQGNYSASATAPGFLPDVVDNVDIGGGDERHIVLMLGAGGNKLTGVVSDVSGGPVSSAVVRLVPVHGILSQRAEHGFAALTDENGRYALNVADGRYSASARHADYVSSSQGIELRGGAKTLDFSLAPGAIVEGVVVAEASGEPVPGATVLYTRERIVNMPGMGAMSVGGTGGAVKADAKGEFRIRGLESGAVKLEARASGMASHEPTTVSIAIAEQQSGVTLYLGSAVSIAGKVIVEEDGEPAVGVRVAAIMPQAGVGIGATAPTGADGVFVIEGVLPGRYRLMAISDDYIASGLGASVTVGEDGARDAVVKVSRGVYVSGRVEPATVADVSVDMNGPRGMPGPGAMMSLALGNASTRTKDDGTFRLGPVKPGALALVAKAADGRKGTADVKVGTTGAERVVIALEAKASLTGRVVDASGAAVSDATVSLRKSQGKRRMVMIVNGNDLTAEQSPTHEDGTFAIRGLDEGSYELVVKDPQGQTLAWAKPPVKDQPTAAMPVELAEAEERSVTLRVEARNGVIKGVVRGPDGSAAADVWVTVTPAMAPFGLGGPGGHGEPHDEDDGEGETTEMRTMMIVAEDDGGGDGGLAMAGSVPPVLTDDRGRFEISGLRKGDYDLMAEGLRGTARGFLPKVQTGAKVTIDLASLTRIEGTVTLGGKPVTSYAVDLSGASMRQKQVRDAGGKFTVHRVDPGEYTVRVTSADGVGEAKVLVEAGKPATVAIDLKTMTTVSGKVVDETGAPIIGAMVLVGAGGGGNVAISMESGDEPPVTGADGTFVVKAGQGQHVLLVMSEAEPAPMVVQPFVVEGDAPVDLGTLKKGQRPER